MLLTRIHSGVMLTLYGYLLVSLGILCASPANLQLLLGQSVWPLLAIPLYVLLALAPHHPHVLRLPVMYYVAPEAQAAGVLLLVWLWAAQGAAFYTPRLFPGSVSYRWFAWLMVLEVPVLLFIL